MKITNQFGCPICKHHWNEEIEIPKGKGIGQYETKCPTCNHKINIPIVFDGYKENLSWPEDLTNSVKVKSNKKIILLKYLVVLFLYLLWKWLSNPPLWSTLPVLFFMFQYIDWALTRRF